MLIPSDIRAAPKIEYRKLPKRVTQDGQRKNHSNTGVVIKYAGEKTGAHVLFAKKAETL